MVLLIVPELVRRCLSPPYVAVLFPLTISDDSLLLVPALFPYTVPPSSRKVLSEICIPVVTPNIEDVSSMVKVPPEDTDTPVWLPVIEELPVMRKEPLPQLIMPLPFPLI